MLDIRKGVQVMKSYLALLVLLSLLGCSADSNKLIKDVKPSAEIEIIGGGNEEVSAKYREGVKSNSVGINKLTGSMLSNIEGDKGVISGFSAYSALAAIDEWTQGQTKEEINNALGNIDKEALEYSKTVFPIETGSLFLVDNELKLNTTETDKFIFEDLQSDGIVDKVNKYVSEKTHNVISALLSKPFSDATKAVLLDTIYFKGSWEYEFSESMTKEDTFYGKDKSTVVPFMKNKENYGVDTEKKRITLPYKQRNITMDILYDVTDIESEFKGYLSDIENNKLDYKYDYEVALTLPKFEIETEQDIIDSYVKLGITALFSSKADLSKLADNLYVDEVKQKAKIIVDEKGTEAAAVTEVAIGLTCVQPVNEELEVNVNKPFIYVIRDTVTNTILFAGFVNNF